MEEGGKGEKKGVGVRQATGERIRVQADRMRTLLDDCTGAGALLHAPVGHARLRRDEIVVRLVELAGPVLKDLDELLVERRD